MSNTDIAAKVAKMRMLYYKKYKKTPTTIRLGVNRIVELRSVLEDFRDIEDEELFSDARFYGMKIVKHDNPNGLEVL